MWTRKTASSSELDHRQQRIPLFQHVGVLVEDGRAEEDQEVAGDVDDEIKNKCEAGDADENFRADRRSEERVVAMTSSERSVYCSRHEQRAS